MGAEHLKSAISKKLRNFDHSNNLYRKIPKKGKANSKKEMNALNTVLQASAVAQLKKAQTMAWAYGELLRLQLENGGESVRKLPAWRKGGVEDGRHVAGK
jgi:phage-related protein